MKKCKQCGEEFSPTAAKPGYVWQCWECGREGEKEMRVRASQAESDDGLGWQVERRGFHEEGKSFKLIMGLRAMQFS